MKLQITKKVDASNPENGQKQAQNGLFDIFSNAHALTPSILHQ